MTRTGLACLIGMLLMMAHPATAKHASVVSQCPIGYTITCTPPVSPPVTPPPPAPSSPCAAKAGYTLALCDQFTSLDPTKWSIQQASGPAAINLQTTSSNGGAYNEIEAYLPNQYEMVAGGGIKLVATQQSFSAIGGTGNHQCADFSKSYCSFPWTSAEINGRGGVVVQPGYVQFAATLHSSPTATGTWPALWLYSDDSSRYAEIDVSESFSNDPTHTYMHLHYGNPGSHGNDNAIGFCPTGEPGEADPAGLGWTGSHTFAVDWNPVAGKITGYIDGTACGTVTAGEKPDTGSSPVWIPNVPLYPIVNLAISPGATGGPFETTLNSFVNWTNNAVPAEPVPAYVAAITFDKPSYNPGDTAKIGFTIHAGSTSVPAGTVQLSMMDFLGDGNGFVEGSTTNQTFPPNTWYYAPITAIAAGASATFSYSLPIPAGTPAGVYSVIFDQAAVGYAHVVVGNALPPAP